MDDRDLLSSAAGSTPECLTPGQLEQAMAGAGSASVRKHLAACAHCQTELALMQQFLDAEPTAAEARAVKEIEARLRGRAWREAPTPAGWRQWFMRPLGGLVLAGLAAALFIGLWLRTPASTGPLVFTEDTTRAASLEGLSPVGDLTEAPTVLRWGAVPGAQRYQVVLLDVASLVLWQGSASQAELAVPEPARLLMVKGKPLFWRVEAFDAANRRIAAGTPARFQVVTRQ